MALVTATGSWNTTVSLEAVTGFRFYQTGIIDALSGSVKAEGRSRWSDHATWGDFTDWITTRDPIKWTAPQIDIGSVKYFTVTVETDFDGTPSHYDIAVSETGEFAGEETLYKIFEGDLNVAAFYGRYVYVTFTVSGTELRRMTVTTNTETQTIYYNNLSTSTLGGTVNSRTLPITAPISQVVDMDIRVVASSSYQMDVYVTDTPTSTALVPVVISKGTQPTFCLVGLDNQNRNGVVDIEVRALPRQAVIGGNIIAIS